MSVGGVQPAFGRGVVDARAFRHSADPCEEAHGAAPRGDAAGVRERKAAEEGTPLKNQAGRDS